MRILFIDDEPEHIEPVVGMLEAVLDATVVLVPSIEGAVAALQGADSFDLIVTDVFIPLGSGHRAAIGPRARHYQDTVQHLGGLVLLDELDRMESAPVVLAYTACTDFSLIEIMGERVFARVPKPAPAEVLLRYVLEALGLPVPG